jgi:molecular chaperone Hsp33
VTLRTDLIQPFQIDDLGVRGRLVRLGPALEAAMDRHGYPAPVAAMMGEAMALTALLASSLKYDGIFALQTQSDGPLNLMVADMTSDGVLRGYARFDAAGVQAFAEHGRSAVSGLLGAGHMAFTVDQGPDTDRYQGITALEGATLADCANGYFRHSEQLATALKLTCDGAGNAAALMVQRLPAEGEDHVDRTEDAWRRAVILMSSVTDAELLDGGLLPNDLLFRLFHEDGVRVFEPRALRHGCRCSRAKVERTLKSFPREEIEAMADDGAVTVNCEFCKTDYLFAAADLDGLFEGG